MGKINNGKQGMVARRRHYEKLKAITEEEALENFRIKQRRLAEKCGRVEVSS